MTLASIERYEQQAAEYERLVEIALRPFAEKIELMCTVFAVTPRLAWRIGWRRGCTWWRPNRSLPLAGFLALVRAGASRGEIAQVLGVKERTVDGHVRRFLSGIGQAGGSLEQVRATGKILDGDRTDVA